MHQAWRQSGGQGEESGAVLTAGLSQEWEVVREEVSGYRELLEATLKTQAVSSGQQENLWVLRRENAMTHSTGVIIRPY